MTQEVIPKRVQLKTTQVKKRRERMTQEKRILSRSSDPAIFDLTIFYKVDLCSLLLVPPGALFVLMMRHLFSLYSFHRSESLQHHQNKTSSSRQKCKWSNTDTQRNVLIFV